jgi:hypothetical protein
LRRSFVRCQTKHKPLHGCLILPIQKNGLWPIQMLNHFRTVAGFAKNSVCSGFGKCFNPEQLDVLASKLTVLLYVSKISFFTAAMSFLFVSFQGCKKDPNRLATSQGLHVDMSLAAYWSKCAASLGPFPPLTCQEGDYSRAHGGVQWKGKVLEIPVERYFSDTTSRNSPGHFKKISNADLLNPLQLVSPENGTCLKPSFNSQESGQCIPGNRLLWFSATVPLIGEVQWAGFCRNEYARPIGAPFYDVISLIGHSPKTGDTCFFESKFSETAVQNVKTIHGPEKRSVYFGSILPEGDVWSQWLSAKKIDSIDAKVRLYEEEIRSLNPVKDPGSFGWALPSPDDVNADRFYESPSRIHNFPGACHLCHTTGPWIKNQFIGDSETTPHSVIPRPKTKRYRVVGFEDLVAEVGRELVTPKRLVPSAGSMVKNCTTCHEIGNLRYCKDLVPISLAVSPKDPITSLFSNETKTYMERIWNARADLARSLASATVHSGHGPNNRFLGLNKLSEKEVSLAAKSVIQCCYKSGGPECIWESIPGWHSQ